MANVDIAAQIAAAMQSDPKVNAAMTEWLDERYPMEISETITSAGLRDALRLMLGEARARADAQDRRLDRMSELIAHVVDRQDAADARFEAFMNANDEAHALFREELREHRETILRLESGQSAILAQLAEHSDSFARLDRSMQRMSGRIGNTRGMEIERKLRRSLQSILINRFGCSRGQIVWYGADGGYGSPGSAFGAYRARLDVAVDEGRINSDEFVGLESADIIAKGLFKSDGSDVWIIGEASGVLSEDDIDRASDRALALSKFEGVVARAFVYGEYIDRTAEDYAKANEVEVIIDSHL